MAHECIADLVAQAKEGDEAAFSLLAARYRHGFYALCLDRTGGFDWAEDLTQETMIRAPEHLPSLRDDAAFAGWLRQIALNCCRAWLRRSGPRARSEEPREGGVAADAYQEAARRDAARSVRAALQHLPENNRLALVMFYLRGDTYREVAEFLGVPESPVVGRLHRARWRLRRLLEGRVRRDLERERSSEEREEAPWGQNGRPRPWRCGRASSPPSSASACR